MILGRPVTMAVIDSSNLERMRGGESLVRFLDPAPLHVSYDRIRLKGGNMQQFKVSQRPLRV